ncbi:hypothetical protein MNEG_2595 [Monoraphidium neglectum]|uniref:Uncharacterized protein n=1 Tax=Monoraphidium neglectum TaxID=145388 RepID=A0A0D2MYC9_9CHLO|nr:hypothetical protein MNEG_2595 [Monoraphidium neglectum]KIZ05362.1 hypothetical protein MNEG_2595 [Monoraphidium neglectum]|eukprot:XP_013904381.1 hypothetical protein MNEG_2595 [Monoraphidium neglectum]
MASSALSRALERFSADLRGLTARVSDGVTSLKRGAESRPHAGVDAFRENLDDLEQQAADIAAEVQQLERCTTDAVSFEELLGHCVELYHSNRDGMTALVAHLERYGYQQPVSARREPDDPCSTALAAASAYGADELCFADDLDAEAMLLDSPRAAGQKQRNGQQQETQPQHHRHGDISTASSPGGRRAHAHAPQPYRSLPSSPVSAGLLASGYVPSRLGIGQPGSPAHGTGAAAAAAAAAAFALGGPAGGTTASKAAAQPRVSMGAASSSSLTPEGLSMLSPGLADKYACPSSGVPSVGGVPSAQGAPSMASGGSAVPSISLSAPRRSTCRDLRMDYGRCSSDSPNLPIFGKTPRSTSLPASTVSDMPEAEALSVPPAGRAGGGGDVERRAGPLGSGGSGGNGGCAGASPLPDSATTGDLYDLLIRSNMGLPLAEGLTQTPPGVRAAGPGEKRGGGGGQGLARPTTPGSTLPAGWHQNALQELDSLSLTLSQMRRSPSRGRLAAAAAEGGGLSRGGAGDEGESEGEACEEEDVTLGERLEAAAAEALASSGGDERGWGGAGAAGAWETRSGGDDAAGRRRSRGSPGGAALSQQWEEALSPGKDQDFGARKLGVSPARQQQKEQQQQQQPQEAPATPTTRAALRRQLQAQREAAAAAAPVGRAEFSSLPAWCNRQLCLEELNRALEGMGAAVADGRPTAPEGAPPGCVGLETLEALGFDAAKGRAILNCLSKLGRTQLQRAGGGGVAYRLVASG